MHHPHHSRIGFWIVTAAATLALLLITPAASAAKGIIKIGNAGGGQGTIVVTVGGQTVVPGQRVFYDEISPATEGDLVDFNVILGGGSNVIVENITIDIEGTLITGVVGNLVIGPGESAIITAAVTGNVTVNGGTLLVSGSSTVQGNMMTTNSTTLILECSSVVECSIITLPPSCPPDSTGPGGLPDGQVNVTDLLALLAAWGVCP